MTKSLPVNVIVQDEYTKKSLSQFRKTRGSLMFWFDGKSRNIHDDMSVIMESLEGDLDPLVKDLYRIALVVYLWDLNTKRKQIEPRYFSVLMSVSSKEKWEAVKIHLEGTLGFLSGDTFDFHFVQGRRSSSVAFPRRNDKCVALFSGGLDSLAGFKWMLNNKLDPILVSHQSASLTAGIQRSLVDLLQGIIGKPVEWHQIRAVGERKKGLTGIETTQFSRSFLYLTIGAIFALAKGASTEYIFENGVIALNIPLTPSRIYSNTRTAHPQFLSKYQVLLDSLFGRRVNIRNPFLEMTKGEVVELLNSKGFRDLVSATITCPYCLSMRWKRVSTTTTKNDGYCFPCIVRRSAVYYASLEKYDGHYQEDVTGEYSKISQEGKKILLEMFDFARQMDKFSNVDEALLEYPQFYVGESADPVALFSMVKRHNDQLRTFMSNRGHETLRQNLNLT